ncbi:GspH/FimT family pseudopilin [Shewanella sp. YIC-542]|uniref:GspH/FimT family pseudopilin n=1 Tax=Shewanella mytili TaxID=3377111 RepID=UPI00398EA5C1
MRPTNVSGFTLVETIVALLVLTILLGVAIPSLTELQRQYRTDAAMRQLQQFIALARNQAINYRTRVVVCRLENNSCLDSDWQAGISAFIDNNDDRIRDSSEPLLQESGTFHREDGIFYNRKAIRFMQDGLATGSNGTLSYCPDNLADNGQALIVNQAGRTRRSNAGINCPG